MEKIVFLHIPKTGGSSFSSILQSFFPIEKRFHVHAGATITARAYYEISANIFRELDQKIVDAVDLIHGHMPFHYDEKYAAFSYVTFFREPVKRVVSDYLFSKSTPHLPLFHLLKDMSLKAYVSQNTDLHLDNLQTRIISGRLTGEVDRSHADEALDRITRQFKIFGITESFDLSLVMLKEQLGWQRYPAYGSRKNQTKPVAYNVTEQDLYAVRQFNEIDKALYENANKLFNALVSSKRAHYDGELKRLHAINKSLAAKEWFSMGIKKILRRW